MICSSAQARLPPKALLAMDGAMVGEKRFMAISSRERAVCGAVNNAPGCGGGTRLDARRRDFSPYGLGILPRISHTIAHHVRYDLSPHLRLD
jgi:hypothetical protein